MKIEQTNGGDTFVIEVKKGLLWSSGDNQGSGVVETWWDLPNGRRVDGDGDSDYEPYKLMTPKQIKEFESLRDKVMEGWEEYLEEMKGYRGYRGDEDEDEDDAGLSQAK